MFRSGQYNNTISKMTNGQDLKMTTTLLTNNHTYNNNN
jgi:hypothetical protein